MSVKPIPEGFHSLTVYLGVKDAAKAIEFYKKAFGAVENFRLDGPDGRVGHAELQIGDSKLMLADPCDQGGMSSPDASGKTPFSMHLYVPDLRQRLLQRAVDAGAEGRAGRSGSVLRRSRRGGEGSVCHRACHQHAQRKTLTPDQIRQRAEAAFKQMQG